MKYPYKGAGILFSRFNSLGDFQVCLGKRSIDPQKGVYSIIGGGSNFKTISLGRFQLLIYNESYSQTAIREAKEESKIIGSEFPRSENLKRIQIWRLGFFNWNTYGYHFPSENVAIQSKSCEFESLDWYTIDNLPDPLFCRLDRCIVKWEKWVKGN
ncbi:MAG: NUDIX hydrolase [Leptospira sp.]|nr:NUDIX hydrolase [Leptospira sp.]